MLGGVDGRSCMCARGTGGCGGGGDGGGGKGGPPMAVGRNGLMAAGEAEGGGVTAEGGCPPPGGGGAGGAAAAAETGAAHGAGPATGWSDAVNLILCDDDIFVTHQCSPDTKRPNLSYVDRALKKSRAYKLSTHDVYRECLVSLQPGLMMHALCRLFRRCKQVPLHVCCSFFSATP